MRALRFLITLSGLVVAGAAFAGPVDHVPLRDSEPRLNPDGTRTAVFGEEQVSRIIFLNRCADGCTITPGGDNARANTSSIAQDVSQLPAYPHGDTSWDQVVACVKEIYAPYDVEVTDVDPGDVPHHEAIVAGRSIDIGYGSSDGAVWGVAPSICEPRDNVISFTFAQSIPDRPITICAVIAQESAHSYGLEHAFNCADPLTYLGACGRQFFRPGPVACGEYEARERCRCGGSAQDSHAWLKTVLGENPSGVPGPDVTLLQPDEGASVEGRFTIAGYADDLRGVERVEMWINGTEYAEQEGRPGSGGQTLYNFAAPADLSDGVLDVELRAYNDIGTETIAKVTVTKGSPCASADQCAAGQECTGGRCIWPAPTGELGDACEGDMQCVSGSCARNADGESHCTTSCRPYGADTGCPSSFDCIETGVNQGVCWPKKSGGCRVSARDRGWSMGALALAMLCLVSLSRRRRPVSRR